MQIFAYIHDAITKKKINCIVNARMPDNVFYQVALQWIVFVEWKFTFQSTL